MNRPQEIKIIPTRKALGAEIEGIDFAYKVPNETKKILINAWIEHLVLLFRNQNITEQQHINATHIFGEIQISAAKSYYEANGKKEAMAATFPEISIVHNLDSDGNPVILNQGLGSGEVFWHSDNSYINTPPAGSMLYAKIIPPTGGDTCFSNQYLAYEKLPREILNKIQGKTAVHDSSRDGSGLLRPGIKLPTKLSEVPGPHHPLIRSHPISMKKALYLGRKRNYPSQYIQGIPEEESSNILDFLWDHACQEEFIWCHRWKLGDLILWDNRCTMHYRHPFPGEFPRIMHRTLIKGEVPQ